MGLIPLTQEQVIAQCQAFGGKSNIVSCDRFFIELVDDFKAGFMLSQLIFWSRCRSNAREGWIYKSHEDWKKDLSFTRGESRGATKRLVELGIVKTECHHPPGRDKPVTHYQLQWPRLTELVNAYYARQATEDAPEPDYPIGDFNHWEELPKNKDLEAPPEDPQIPIGYNNQPNGYFNHSYKGRLPVLTSVLENTQECARARETHAAYNKTISVEDDRDQAAELGLSEDQKTSAAAGTDDLDASPVYTDPPALETHRAAPCIPDPAFPCTHQQDLARVIAPIVGHQVCVRASDVPPEVAHDWTADDVSTLYKWLTTTKAPSDPTWWRLRNAFSFKHRDDHLAMAKAWKTERDQKEDRRQTADRVFTPPPDEELADPEEISDFMRHFDQLLNQGMRAQMRQAEQAGGRAPRVVRT